MTARLRMALWFLFGSAGIIVLGAMSVAIFNFRGTICRELTYDGGYICLSNAGERFWFETRPALSIAVLGWVSSNVIIPILVARKTRRSGWPNAALLLVFFTSVVGHFAAQYWTEREYPGMYAPNGERPPILWINVVFSMLVAFFVTFAVVAPPIEPAEIEAEIAKREH